MYQVQSHILRKLDPKNITKILFMNILQFIRNTLQVLALSMCSLKTCDF